LEGNTPLFRAKRLAQVIAPTVELYLKFEGMNPSGSFKDRGMTLAISKAVEAGSKTVICASTGNTSASAAAYSAHAGLETFVLIPEGKIAMGKLAQAIIHGATVIQVEGNFDQALSIVKQLSTDFSITLVNSINPHRLEGQKTAAFEVCDALGEAPEFHFLPVGNAGNITAYWKGYQDYRRHNKITRFPKMMGFQAEGAAPIVLGRVVENPKTVATAIRIGNPASWKSALKARDESGGIIDRISDEEILEAYQKVASLEGIFCEPASAASVAGLAKWYQKGQLQEGGIVVCTLTGHGLKDAGIALEVSQKPISVKADFQEVAKVMGL
jgi:threonine synthase